MHAASSLKASQEILTKLDFRDIKNHVAWQFSSLAFWHQPTRKIRANQPEIQFYSANDFTHPPTKCWSGFASSFFSFHPQWMVLIKIKLPVPSEIRRGANKWVSIQVHWARYSHRLVFDIHFQLGYSTADHRHIVSHDLSHNQHSTQSRSRLDFRCNLRSMNSSEIAPLLLQTPAWLMIRELPCFMK